MRLRTLLLASIAFAALPASAHAAENVVASIKPVHSLVAAVMEGVGEPALIVQDAGSEHRYSLRPSDARALEQAGLVFWVGPEMETFLENPIATLAADAVKVALAETPGLTLLEFREGGPFEAHDHESGDHHDHGEEATHGHDDHAHAEETQDHGHGQHGHAHAEEATGEHGHAHGTHDMHVWLDPENAILLVAEIERRLSEADPANAATYRENAAAYSARLEALTAEVAAALEPVRDKPFVVFHDAYQYFENRFGVTVAGSITVNPEVMPGAQRIREIREKVRALGATCVFSEPQFEPRLVGTVIEGTGARTGVLDPLGADLEDGPDLYPQLIRDMAASIGECLADGS